MKKILILFLFAAHAAYAAGDPAAGAQKIKACTACHGENFDRPVTPDTPRLAGQHADYLARALSDYKSGARKNPIMSGQAAPLSSQDIQDIAAYLGGLEGGLHVIRLHRLAQ